MSDKIDSRPNEEESNEKSQVSAFYAFGKAKVIKLFFSLFYFSLSVPFSAFLFPA